MPPGLLVTAVLLAAIVALSPAENMLSIRRLVGFDDDRLAAAPQRGSDEPVAYDPCRPAEVVRWRNP